ncbi:MAG: hypothetical protein KJ714_06100 [Euryarchaeota archaeon]|nr:hypothetical protein [Euryarchaeota archaeon]
MENIKQAGVRNKELEKAPPDKKDDIVEVIFREAHSLKGAAETHNQVYSSPQNGKC